MNWQPVPDGVPARAFLAYVSGAILLVGGVGMLVKRTARVATLIMTLFVFSWLLLLQLPRLAPHPGDVGIWLGFCENLLLVTGGWVLFVQASRADGVANPGFFASEAGLRTARTLFALALPVIGLSHFVYVDVTTKMVPAWLPSQRGFAYLTGAGHMAAGIGILFGVLPRLAATMEAAMLSCFVVLLHVPLVMAKPTDRFSWTMLLVATAYTGASWAIAASLSEESWGRLPWTKRSPVAVRSAA
jgi:uncharacterized membrane protein